MVAVVVAVVVVVVVVSVSVSVEPISCSLFRSRIRHLLSRVSYEQSRKFSTSSCQSLGLPIRRNAGKATTVMATTPIDDNREGEVDINGSLTYWLNLKRMYEKREKEKRESV